MISTYTLNTSTTANSILPFNNKLIIKGTRNTPWVMYDGHSGILEIKGMSSPENSIEFFSGIYDQIDNLSTTFTPTFQLNVALKYFNTSSTKCLFDIFRKLTLLAKSSTIVVVNWFYEEGDDDMLESGEDFADITDLKFNFIETE